MLLYKSVSINKLTFIKDGPIKNAYIYKLKNKHKKSNKFFLILFTSMKNKLYLELK